MKKYILAVLLFLASLYPIFAQSSSTTQPSSWDSLQGDEAYYSSDANNHHKKPPKVVPEPEVYGAAFVGLSVVAIMYYRNRKGKKQKGEKDKDSNSTTP